MSGGRPGSIISAALLLGAGVALGLAAPAVGARAHAVVPPNNPAGNIAANPPVFGPWSCSTDGSGVTSCSNPCIANYPHMTENDSTGCVDAVVSAIDNARAQEGVGPVTLPTNWYGLSVPEQLFVITDLERVDRGLTPYLGLVTSLDNDAQGAANAGSEPTFGGEFAASSWTSAWSLGEFNPLAAEYGWMYEDGWGGSRQNTYNSSCNGPGGESCWAHRDSILGNSGCTNCVMGAGYAATTATGSSFSYAQLFVMPIGNAQAPSFTWAGNVLPYLDDANAHDPASVIGIARTLDGKGYWLADSAGDVFAFGDAASYGSMAGQPLNAPIVSIATGPAGVGYWLLGADGGIFSFGNAQFYGSTGAQHLNAPVFALAATPDGKGYWFVARDGGIFAFGDAAYEGSLPGLGVHVSDIVGIVATADGRGYWMVGADGGTFAFGDAGYVGSLPQDHVSVGDIVGMVPAHDARGYLMVGSDGGAFAFGDVPYEGSLPGDGVTTHDIVDITPTPNNLGYWMVGADGGVFSFGNAGFYGSRV